MPVENEITIKQAMARLRKALIEEPDYMWGWQSNLAMRIFDDTTRIDLRYDERKGLGLAKKSNYIAANILQHVFDYDFRPSIKEFSGEDV